MRYWWVGGVNIPAEEEGTTVEGGLEEGGVSENGRGLSLPKEFSVVEDLLVEGEGQGRLEFGGQAWRGGWVGGWVGWRRRRRFE